MLRQQETSKKNIKIQKNKPKPANNHHTNFLPIFSSKHYKHLNKYCCCRVFGLLPCVLPVCVLCVCFPADFLEGFFCCFAATCFQMFASSHLISGAPGISAGCDPLLSSRVPVEAGDGRGGRLRDLRSSFSGHAEGEGQRGGVHREAV